MKDLQSSKFPSAFEIPSPNGADGWENLYPYYTKFQEHKRDSDDKKFWFCNSQHWPKPFRPFDTIMLDFAIKGLGQYNSRHLLIPPANGIEYRILNGYVYFSPVAVDPEKIDSRIPHFIERAGHYYENWDELLGNWKNKVMEKIDEMNALKFNELPEFESIKIVTEGIGLDSTNPLFQNYEKAIELVYKIWQYHFEFLNLGYAAYLDFFTFVKEQFPSISDQAIAKMVQGVNSELFRPDDELKKLAKLAVKYDLAENFEAKEVDKIFELLSQSKNGKEWILEWEKSKDPWFNFTSGNGFYSSDKYWIDHLDIPMAYLKDYIKRIKNNEEIMRPTEKLISERDRITSEYRELMDEDARSTFDEKITLSRKVFPYVEDHNFYIEHWALGTFWRKMRELSKMLHKCGFWDKEDDMFYLSRTEVRDVLWDYASSWAIGSENHGKDIWPKEIEHREKILKALSSQPPIPALNNPPKLITEPFTIMLWGITSESVERWLSSKTNESHFKGMAGSPGIVEGIARVLRGPEELNKLQKGDILVTPVTAPSWAPVFGRINAAVTDIGGMMSHAAIVCREYGLPAVTGTGDASSKIKTGMRIRVDGNEGIVSIL